MGTTYRGGLFIMAKVILAKIAVKERNKDKDLFKNISSSDKDELLYELCKKQGLIPNIPYE